MAKLAIDLWVDGETVSKFSTRIHELTMKLIAASHALHSYHLGNSAPDLAKELADSIDLLIAKEWR